MDDPNPALIERARSGDPEAVGALWRAHRGWVAATLLAHAPSGADLEDLLQEVAVGLVQRIATLRETDRFRPWLRVVAWNVARSAGRRESARRRALRPLGDADAALPAARDESAARHARESLERLMERLRALPSAYREPLLLQAVRGLSQAEVAETLGVPVTTIETRLARARRLLREGANALETRTTRP